MCFITEILKIAFLKSRLFAHLGTGSKVLKSYITVLYLYTDPLNQLDTRVWTYDTKVLHEWQRLLLPQQASQCSTLENSKLIRLSVKSSKSTGEQHRFGQYNFMPSFKSIQRYGSEFSVWTKQLTPSDCTYWLNFIHSLPDDQQRIRIWPIEASTVEATVIWHLQWSGHSKGLYLLCNPLWTSILSFLKLR